MVDYNGLQIDGSCSDVNDLGGIEAKFAAFGWRVLEVDGHDVPALLDAFGAAREVDGRPTVLVCKTVKGKGVSFMENNADWHGRAPSVDETECAFGELSCDTREGE